MITELQKITTHLLFFWVSLYITNINANFTTNHTSREPNQILHSGILSVGADVQMKIHTSEETS